MSAPDPDDEPTTRRQPAPTIRVTENGPYLVEGGLEVRSAGGAVLDTPDRYALCRCGGSANKPFCDGTHARIDFDGTETADHGPIARRQDDYVGRGVTIHDDRTVCSHAGLCTDNLAAVFKLGKSPGSTPPPPTPMPSSPRSGSAPRGPSASASVTTWQRLICPRASTPLRTAPTGSGVGCKS